MNTKAWSVLLVGAAALATAWTLNPAAGAAGTHATAGAPYVRTELFFGTARPNGGPAVTDKQFADFVDSQVSPRFPAGLTVEDARGQYRDRHGVIEREHAYVVILLYPTKDANANSPKIEQLRAAYDQKFQQESVARVDEAAKVEF